VSAAGRIQATVLDPDALAPDVRARLTDELHVVQQEVFDGVDREAFRKYVVESPASRNWLQVYRDPEGKAVGYMALHRFDRELDGRPCAIFRAEAGTVRAWRGRTPLGGMLARALIRHQIRHPRVPIFYLGSLVHPSSYHAFARFAARIHPGLNETPPRLQKLLTDLGDAFGLSVVDPERPLVRKVGWITRDTEVERDYWQRCEKPTVRFFVEANPGYVEGHGLLTLVPFDVRSGLIGIGRFLRGRLRRRLTALSVHLRRLPLPKPRPKPAALAVLLGRSKELSRVEPSNLPKIATAATLETLPGGRRLFLRNDRADAMYLVLEGAIYLLTDDGAGGDVVLDQLSAGHLFGEAALLPGQVHPTTARAACASRLLRIDGPAVQHLMEDEPSVRDALWGLFGRRLFDGFVRRLDRFAGMTRADRMAWYDGAKVMDLDVGVSIEVEDETMFLATGTIEVNQQGAWIGVNAPSLLVLSEPTRLKAGPGTRLLELHEPEILPEPTTNMQIPAEALARGRATGRIAAVDPDD